MIKVYTIEKKSYCSFKSEEILNNKHIPLCTDVENVLTIMPEKIKVILKNIELSHASNATIYDYCWFWDRYK